VACINKINSNKEVVLVVTEEEAVEAAKIEVVTEVDICNNNQEWVDNSNTKDHQCREALTNNSQVLILNKCNNHSVWDLKVSQ